MRLQLLQILALVVVAGEGDIEPGIVGIVVVVCPVVVTEDLQKLFFSQDSILELAKVHAGKARPPKRASVKPGNFQLL